MPSTVTVVVDRPVALPRGGWSQVHHTYAVPGDPPGDTTYDITAAGISLAAEVVRNATQSVSCTFAPPILEIAWPPQPGARFAGDGTCGSISVSVSGGISGTVTTRLDGSSVTADVVDSTVTFHTPATASATETDWFAPTLGLDVREAIDQHYGTGPRALTSSATRILTSAQPH